MSLFHNLHIDTILYPMTEYKITCIFLYTVRPICNCLKTCILSVIHTILDPISNCIIIFIMSLYTGVKFLTVIPTCIIIFILALDTWAQFLTVISKCIIIFILGLLYWSSISKCIMTWILTSYQSLWLNECLKCISKSPIPVIKNHFYANVL